MSLETSAWLFWAEPPPLLASPQEGAARVPISPASRTGLLTFSRWEAAHFAQDLSGELNDSPLHGSLSEPSEGLCKRRGGGPPALPACGAGFSLTNPPGGSQAQLQGTCAKLPQGRPHHPVPAVGTRFLQLSEHPAGERGASLLSAASSVSGGFSWGLLCLVLGVGQEREWYSLPNTV